MLDPVMKSRPGKGGRQVWIGCLLLAAIILAIVVISALQGGL